jgi:hypothetical protein
MPAVTWRRKAPVTSATKIGQPWSASISIPAPGRLHAWEADAPFEKRPELVCLLGAEPPRLVRGLGGWEQIARGQRRAASHWPGSETPAFEIEVLLENRAVPTGVNGVVEKMRVLERLCGPPFRTGNAPPPLIQWAANHPLHDNTRRPNLKWVCESFDYGRSVYDDSAVLLGQWATFTVAIYESDELERLRRADPFKRETLRKGETLRHFAKRVLGDAKRWADIADLNRDTKGVPKTPDAKAKKAMTLAVPPREKRQRQARRR